MTGGLFFLLITLECCVYSVYISEWIQVESQKSSPVLIQHPLQQIPAKVDVQVKIQEKGYDVIFPAFGSAQRDDDDVANIYGGVVYIYNENHVKIFVPIYRNGSNKGVLIFTGGSAFSGPFDGIYSVGFIRIKVWGLCDLPPAKFTSYGIDSISTRDSYKIITHGLEKTPDFVVVQLKMNDGNVSEAAGVTFNSRVFGTHETICGTVYAFNDQEIRIWSMYDYVACAYDGWGALAESFRGHTASLYIQAWILDSCNKHFSTQFTLDKNDINTVERVSLDSVYDLNSTLVSVLMKVSSPNNEGFMFHAGGSAMIDTSDDPYGAIIYGYNETEVMLWRPSQTNTNGHLVYVGGKWGDGHSNQESDVVEVIVKVIEITGTPCNGTKLCSPDWSKTRCISTDCPIPPDIENAYKIYEGVTNGSKTLYFCKPGYTESSDNVIISCVEGTWSLTSMFCRVVCSTPPAVENTTVFVQDNRAKYHCLTGYFAMKNTDDVIECRNSTWPSTDFKCIKSCPEPPAITNADVMVSENVALYSCRQGFLAKSGTNSINCLQSEWQKTNFICYASSCGPVPNITNADFLVDNDVAMYACRYGYRPTNAENTITCMSGKWTDTSLQCEDTTKGLRSYITYDMLEEWILEMKKNLSVHKSNTSAYNRSLISVYESRPSAVQIGSFGVFLISFTIIVLILPDIVAVVKNLCNKISKNFRHRRRGRDEKC